MRRSAHPQLVVVSVWLAATAPIAGSVWAQDLSLKATQAFLDAHGYRAGRPDGLMGPVTQGAIRSFQADHGLPVTGKIDDATLNAIAGIRSHEDGSTAKPAPRSTQVTTPSTLPPSVDTSATAPPETPSGTVSAGTGSPDSPTAPAAPVISGAPEVSTPTIASPTISQTPSTTDSPPPTPSPAVDYSGVWLLIAGLAATWVLLDRDRRKRKMAEPRSPKAPTADSAPYQRADVPPPLRLESAVHASPPLTREPTLSTEGGNLTRTLRSAWVPKGETAVVAGREIGGMVYVGPGPRSGRHTDRCRAFIDPALTVAREGGDPQAREMPYWPNYSEITPRARATYLDWHAGGRQDPTYDPGYMFLYFYGLERRFFMDDPSNDEKRDILVEVSRLYELYSDNYSAQNYLGAFVDCAGLLVDDPELLQPVFEHWGYELPLSLKAVLGAMIAREERLNADWLLSWWICHPETSSRTPVRRCFEEFRTLFAARFALRYPDGLLVNKPKKLLEASYSAASSEFTYAIKPVIGDTRPLDISGLRKPIEIAQEIVDGAINDLDKYSRYLGRHPEGRGTIEAHALLPAEVRELFPSEGLDRLTEWVREIVRAGGKVPLADLIERIAGARPDRISKRQQIDTADALAMLGFGLAPDARYALRPPRFDDSVVLFELPNGEHSLEDVSDAYRSALVIVALGAFVAQADGQIAEAERDALVMAADGMDGLSEAERVRLRANIDWLLFMPPDLGPLRERLKSATAEQTASFRRIVVAIAHADSVVSPQEVRGIEKIYRALGLDPKLVYADIHAGLVGDEPITVRQRVEGSGGDPVPAVEAPSPRPILDAARIAAIQADTAHVSSVLGEIFADEPTGETAVEEPTEIFAGLDAKHAALVRILIEREHWSEEEFSDLARTYGLMTAGCLETINEWSFHHFDDALIEEYDGYDVSFAVAERVRGSG